MVKALSIPLLSLWLGLAGCAVAPSATDAGRFTADSLFAPPSRPVDAGDRELLSISLLCGQQAGEEFVVAL